MLVLIVIVVRVNIISITIKIFKHGGVCVEVHSHILRLTRKTHRTQLTIYSQLRFITVMGGCTAGSKGGDAGGVWRNPCRLPTLPVPWGLLEHILSQPQKSSNTCDDSAWRSPVSVLGAGHTGTLCLARPTTPDPRGRAGAQQEAHCLHRGGAGSPGGLNYWQRSGRHQVPGHHWASLTR